jgi:hypothetical protein
MHDCSASAMQHGYVTLVGVQSASPLFLTLDTNVMVKHKQIATYFGLKSSQYDSPLSSFLQNSAAAVSYMLNYNKLKLTEMKLDSRIKIVDITEISLQMPSAYAF